MEKIWWQITVAAFMQPIQYDLRSPAAKDNSITHAATAWSNLDAAITMWVAKHNRTTRNGVGNCSSKTGFRRQSEKKTILKHFIKGFLEGKSLAPKWRKKRISCETSFKTPSATHPPAPLAIPFTLRERSYSCKSQWNSVDRTCTKNTWNPIYNAEPIRPWSENDPTTHETVSHPSHRRGRSSTFEDGLCRRKFRSETSDDMDSWKAEVRRVRREKIRRKKMQMREKVGKSRNTVFFQWFVAPEGRKVGSLKRRVRSQLARWEMKSCTPLWREAHFQVKMYKTPQLRTTFGSWDVEKVHAVVARSTFRSQNVQNTRGSDHFWKLRCRKSARRCGAKQISKSKVLKTDGLGPLLEVQMSKKCQKSARRCGAKHISKSNV